MFASFFAMVGAVLLWAFFLSATAFSYAAFASVAAFIFSSFFGNATKVLISNCCRVSVGRPAFRYFMVAPMLRFLSAIVD